MQRFAERLRAARQAVGMTQEQLGFALGVTKSSVSAWETGRETPSFGLLPALRRSLRCSLDELICGPAVADGNGVREDAAVYRSDHGARDLREQSLLRRYRSLPARRRAALLELIAAGEDSGKS
ncbi:MAG: helix-turn-helix transcriptional regulator [Stagnimonas sp.]|nr:helix-turn-helix transcriptional regulator [Stagnimonas sp.]